MENNRKSILGYPIDLLSKQGFLELVESFIVRQKPCHVVTINPEIIMQALGDTELDKILKEADVVMPEATGIKLAFRFKNINIEKVPGIEFSEKLLCLCEEKGYKVGLLGASEETVTAAVNQLKEKHPAIQIVYAHNGYFNENDENGIIEEVKEVSPQVLFVALGVPKQERFISKYKNILNPCVMLGVGGSFDVWSGKVKRAPVLFRKFGLEWLYRLISQPSRFTRMFPTLPLFLIKAIFLKEIINKKER